jgi:hypothetical protein
MLEYLDASDSDSDFFLGSVTYDTSEDDDAPHPTPLAAHSVSDSEEDDMDDDDDYREILSPEQPLPLIFQIQELSGPKHTSMRPGSLPSASLLHTCDPYTHGDRIQHICTANDEQ